MAHEIRLMLVAGARPNFMKVAPLIRELKRRSGYFDVQLVHTGQHYDDGMSDVFFRDLGIPSPNHHLNVGSGSHAQQTARIMASFEPVLLEQLPHCVIVFGDVNSTLACAIVAKKLGVTVAHVEAGLRSGDRAMPEEINRIVTDSISDYFFVTEESGVTHLKEEGHADSKIHLVGHVMVDNLFFELERLKSIDTSGFASTKLKQDLGRYGVVTLHRPSNVDDANTLTGILGALCELSEDIPLVFPAHPRTKASLDRLDIKLPSSLVVTNPFGYREFLNLWRDAELLLTDSGGLQEESTALGIPCLTLRENTERPITISQGTNQLVGINPHVILSAARNVLSRLPRAIGTRRPPLWDGAASIRITDVLESELKTCKKRPGEPS